MRVLLILFLLTISPITYAGGMMMDDKGMIMNANSNNLPKDCPAISETVEMVIHAGQQYAVNFAGKVFAFDKQEWNVKPCAKLNITFINDDEIRHQLMIHGLPGYLYPEGMFHLELYGKGQLNASLIMPSQKKTYLAHCELPQHAEKGMKAQIKVDGGDGDLPSIPSITAAAKADYYALDWNITTSLLLLIFFILGIIAPLFLLRKKQ
jgi:hypothetical protein